MDRRYQKSINRQLDGLSLFLWEAHQLHSVPPPPLGRIITAFCLDIDSETIREARAAKTLTEEAYQSAIKNSKADASKFLGYSTDREKTDCFPGTSLTVLSDIEAAKNPSTNDPEMNGAMKDA